MLVAETTVHQGGLMRCCLATLSDHVNDEAEVGDTLGCDYEADDEPKMILGNDYVWRWIGAE